MAKLTRLDRVRRKRSVKKSVKYMLVILGMTLAVVLCVTGVRLLWQSPFVERVIMQMTSWGSGDGYPLKLEGKTVQQLESFGPALAVLTDTTFGVYNSSARELQRTQHELNNPQARYSSVRALLFDRGGKKLGVYSSTSQIHSKTMEFAILSASIADSGAFAVVTGGQREVARVYVYDKGGEELFVWHSQERVTNVALSPDGNSMAVSALTTQNGVLKTVVYLFDVRAKKQIKTAEFPDTMLVNLTWRNNAEMFCVFDTQTVVLTRDAVVKYTYSYTGESLSGCYSRDKNYTVLVLGDYDTFKSSKLVVLDGKCEEVGTMTVSEQVLDVKSGENIVVLTGSDIYQYSHAGQLLRQEPFPYEGLKIAQNGSNAYVCTPDSIKKAALKAAKEKPSSSQPAPKESAPDISQDNSSSQSSDASGASADVPSGEEGSSQSGAA